MWLTQSQPMPPPQAISVLVVDDEPRNLVALNATLASVDYRVVNADSGTAALKCVLAEDFAVIVLDVRMHGMGGFETASLIRARERSRSTPIIFLTAYDRLGARELEGYRLGAVDYLYKPFDQQVLHGKVAFFVELFRNAAILEQRTAELNAMAAELERSRAETALRHQALHDGLTGLPNRVLLYERLQQAIDTSDPEQSHCALLLLDLDRFKAVNVLLGHQVGDDLLRLIGQRLQGVVHEPDLLARFGGDEFGVFLAACESRNDKELSMRRCRAPGRAAACRCGVARTDDRQWSIASVCGPDAVSGRRRG
jgi:diguanylate cyclase (GGDEF)-like protein